MICIFHDFYIVLFLPWNICAIGSTNSNSSKIGDKLIPPVPRESWNPYNEYINPILSGWWPSLPYENNESFDPGPEDMENHGDIPNVSLSIYSIDVQANAIVFIDLSKCPKCPKLESTGAIKWAVFISPWLVVRYRGLYYPSKVYRDYL